MNKMKFLLSGMTALSMACQALSGTFKPNDDFEDVIATVSVGRGETHTFIVSGIDAENSAIDGCYVTGTWTYKEDGETWEESIDASEFYEEEIDGKLTWYIAVTAEDWEYAYDPPSSVKFKVILTGWPYDKEDDPQPDRKFEFSHQDGIALPVEPEPAIPVGAADNPANLSVAGTLSTPYTANYTPPESDSYYFQTTLTAGRKYYFGVTASNGSTNSISIASSQGGDDLFLEESIASDYTGEGEWDDCSQAYAFVPRTTMTYSLTVTSPGGMFTLKTALLPSLTPAQHVSKELTVEAPVVFRPGHLNNPTNGNYDGVIDEQLFSFTPEADTTYVFETSGADTNLTMRLYSKDVTDGTAITQNNFLKTYDNNCRIVWTAPSKASLPKFSPVYVGVCQRFKHERLADEETETVSAGEVSLSVREIQVTEETLPLIAVPATEDPVSPVFAENSAPVTARVLSASSWTHTYVIAGRKDVNYRIKTISGDDSGLLLGARVYSRNAQGKSTQIPAEGSLDPHYDGWLSFTPEANAPVYVEVYVEEGEWGPGTGLDFAPYDIYASGYKPETTLSLLKVTLMGAPEDKMTWQLGTESAVQYPGGTAALLEPGNYSVLPKAIENYAVPSADTVTVAGTVCEHMYKYTDTADPLDDRPSGQYDGTRKYAAVKLMPSAKGVSVSRSLWGDEQNFDPADWFVFSGSEGVHYRFELEDVQGAPRITVYDWTMTNAVANFYGDSTVLYQMSVGSEGKNKDHYVKVSHADGSAPVDSAYTLSARSIAVGAVKFQKTAISVKEDAAYAELTVNRTAKEGRVRVRYRTREGTAKPGDRYYPASGELVWEDGDNKAKDIRIRLLPDEKPTYTDGKPVTFDVILETPDASETEDGEYLPAFSGSDTATVTITETAKKTAGSVSVEYAVNGGERLPFSNPKKAVVALERTDRLTLYVSRKPGASGANGAVGVEVGTKNGTANKSGSGTDYRDLAPRSCIWEDGDAETEFVFDVETLANPDDHTASKTFSVTLKALTGSSGMNKLERPTLEVSSVSVTIVNTATQTISDYAKLNAKDLKAEGISSIKETKTGQWILNNAGDAVANVPQTGARPASSDLSFSLTGPGRLTVTPIVPDGAKMICSAGTGRAVQETVCTNGMETVVYVQSGSQTVKFTAEDTGCGLKCRANGLPYLWEQLAAVIPAAPTVDKAAVAPGTNELCFVREEGVSYRVYALSSGEKNAANKPMKLGDPETEVLADADGRFLLDCVHDAKGNKGKYTWRVDSYFEGAGVTNVSRKAFDLVVLPDAEVPATRVSGITPWGNEIDVTGGTDIVLKQGVKTDFAIGEPGSTVKSVSGKLPTGLKLEVDKATKQTYLRGTPSKEGEYQVLLQETSGTAKTAGTTTVLGMTVDPIKGGAIGTFYGLVMSGAPTNGAARAATVSVTAANTGKISAKVALCGKTYTFSDTGYSYLGGERDGEDPQILHARLQQIQKVGTETFTNYLHYAVYETDDDDPESWTLEGMVYLEMNCLPDAKGQGYQSGIVFEDGHFFRDNSKLTAWQTRAAVYEGYYTAALTPVSAGPGEPTGNGYLTLKIDSKGKIKLAGLLADNVKISASSTAYLSKDALNVPVFYCKGTELFVGWIVLADNGAGTVVIVKDASGTPLRWYNDDPNSTEWGDAGFAIDVEAVGGWYNTVFNLQRHYVDYAFKLSTVGVDELPSELVPEGYEFIAGIGPHGTDVDVTGNSVSVVKQSLVKTLDPLTGRKTTINDWDASVNPQNVQLKYVRATGLVSGSFVLWYEGYNARGVFEQKSQTKASHQGVMILGRSSHGCLPESTLTAGFFTIDVTKQIDGTSKTRKWKASFPFNIDTVYTGNDFSE